VPSYILGISAYYHNSAAAILRDGLIVGAAEEERFTRRKHDAAFPARAVAWCLAQARVTLDALDAVVFYDKPILKFERLLQTYMSTAPAGVASFATAMPVWVKEKIFLKRMLEQELAALGPGSVNIRFSEHHLSHQASAFYPSPFEEAAIVTVDGVGEWASTTIGSGEGTRIGVLKENHFPHSLGLLYSAFTYYCGFRVNSGEYKLMGLAPYGDPDSAEFKRYYDATRAHLVDIRPDGSLLLNMEYFEFATGLRMCRDDRWASLFGIPRREGESASRRQGERTLSESYMNLALACQRVTEDVMLQLARTARTLTGKRHLVLAGGVALNCVANGRILREGVFDDLWIQPAAGDAGGALGAALAYWHIGMERPRKAERPDGMRGSYLGESFSPAEVEQAIARAGGTARRFDDTRALCDQVAARLAAGQVVGWFQGRAEFGPRALGNRSILADPRAPEMQKKLNLRIKFREGFRPFAPAVIESATSDYFDLDRPSPYMLLVAPVAERHRNPLPADYRQRPLMDRLYVVRSDVPAVTHVDFSARVQTVSPDTNPRFHALIEAFCRRTSVPVLVNTSFNVRGEPIVGTPEDAYRCFMGTEMDCLVIEDFLLDRTEQRPESAQSAAFALD
jgi:carbamoyltransferase